MDEELESIAAIFRASTDSLIDDEYRVAAGSWAYDLDLPVTSQRALAEWGFPAEFNLIPEFHQKVRTIDIPQDAADFGVKPGSLYVLGGWTTNIGSSSTNLAGVEVGGGSVLDVDLDPLPPERYPAWFWKEYPEYEIRSSHFLASSVEKLCELAWRWHCLWDVLDAVELPIRPTDREIATYYEKKKNLHSAIRSEILAIDPSAIGQDEGRYPWAAVIGEIIEP